MPVSVPSSVGPSPEALEILHVEPGFSHGLWEHYALSIWRAEITVFGLAALGRTMAQLKQRRPGQRLGSVVYLEPECTFGASSSITEAAVDLLKRFEDVRAATAIVYNREGFWSATMRGRITSIHNESKIQAPYALRTSLQEACEWLREAAPELSVQTLPLSRAMETLRAAR